jgi:uncharacterized damage-inducible protein DinB
MRLHSTTSLLCKRPARPKDLRIVNYIEHLQEADIEKELDYSTLNGTPQQQPICEILAHWFNHQTHHRGQAHAVLTLVGVTEPEPLDLLVMQRRSRRSAAQTMPGERISS